MKIDSNAVFLIIAVIIVAAGAYWYFFTGTGNQPPLSPTTVATENQAQTQFQTLVSILQPISFDTKIFSDPRFAVLVDLATPVLPEISGRPDPFAPIAGVSGK